MGDLHDPYDIDDVFRDGLKASERMPSATVWERIDTQLEKEQRRRLFLWWRPLTIAATLLVAACGLWVLPIEPHSTGLAVSSRRDVPQPASKTGVVKASSPKQPMIAAQVKTRPVDAVLPHNDAAAVTTVSPTWSIHPMGPVTVLQSAPFPHIIGKLLPSHTLPGGFLRAGIPRHRLDLSLYASQELAGYTLADHDSTGAHGQEIEKREGTNFSRSVGFLLSYHLRRHWVIQSGLSLSRSFTSSNPGTVVATRDNNGKTTFIVNTVTGYGYVAPDGMTNVGDSATTGKITGRLNYLALPIIVSREWEFGRFSLLAGAGLDGRWLTHATIKTSINGPNGTGRQRQVTQYGLRKVDFGWQVKSEFRYRLSRDFAATLMATFKSSVGPVNIHTPYSTYPYNLGIGLGITRTF